jgi:RNA polymerase sigma factor (sigma-70 family)
MVRGLSKIVLEPVRPAGGAEALREPTDRELLKRFAQDRDEAAFAALVQRHGALVHGVCGRVLRRTEDVEDAFQATFLVLARKAGAVGWRESIGNWLYGVARRLALKSRANSARRLAREREAAEQPHEEAMPKAAWQQLCGVLDEELGQLPRSCREPVLLCYMEGRTRDEAAHQLGWSRRTLHRRLEQGLGLLRERLARRGLAMSVALLALGLASRPSARLMAATTQAAGALATAPTIAGATVSAQAATLAANALRSMALSWLKVGAVAVLSLGILTAGAVLVYQDSPQPEQASLQQVEPLVAAVAAEVLPQPRSEEIQASKDQLPSTSAPRVEIALPHFRQPGVPIRLGAREEPTAAPQRGNTTRPHGLAVGRREAKAASSRDAASGKLAPGKSASHVKAVDEEFGYPTAPANRPPATRPTKSARDP